MIVRAVAMAPRRADQKQHFSRRLGLVLAKRIRRQKTMQNQQQAHQLITGAFHRGISPILGKELTQRCQKKSLDHKEHQEHKESVNEFSLVK
jgi:hypothetical protein